jgi:hypothetical protein
MATGRGSGVPPLRTSLPPGPAVTVKIFSPLSTI